MTRDRNKPRVRRKGILTEKEMKFVALFTGNAKEAAEQAGYRTGFAPKLMKKPEIRAAIEAKQKQVVKEAAKVQVKGAVMGRDYILKRLRALADLSPDDTKGTIAGQVSALKLGAEIQGHIIERSADLTKEFENRSEQDLEFFTTHGYWPNSVDPGQSRPN